MSFSIVESETDDEAKGTLIYAYEENIITFKLHTGNQEVDVANALNLVAYLRTNVSQDGIALEHYLIGKHILQWKVIGILVALPRLPKRAVKSHPKSVTEFTL